MDAIITLVNPDIKYIGLIQGKVKQDISDISNIIYNDTILTDSSNKKQIPLEDLISFSYKGKERDPEKFADYIFSLEIDGKLFLNKNYISALSKISIKRRIKKYSKWNDKILGKKESLLKKFFLFLEEKELVRRELMKNPMRLDDSLLKITEGQVLIYGAKPIYQNKEYVTIKRDNVELKCYKNNIKFFPSKEIVKTIAKKREILVGGCYFSKENKLIIHYLRTNLIRYFFPTNYSKIERY